MRIKEYGHIKPKEVKCNGCGAILEYTNVDLQLAANFHYMICCPICNKQIFKDNSGRYLKRF